MSVPDTVSRAIRSELELEEAELCAALDDFSGTSSGPETENARHWEFDHPRQTVATDRRGLTAVHLTAAPAAAASP
ncbi:hypothetical protein GCM10017771_35620 [Streptomyces capitiformicae]|uniref:Uncharacterized protein n=1 Tax=Streptomyces capitiformicae TaxID=2014920 RepID=A0A919GRP1_9ACTN|nr:hypothetical protein GCM10017771_35620 [Streptomyces capitiformicae]